MLLFFYFYFLKIKCGGVAGANEMCFSAHMLLLKFCFVPLVKKVLKSQSPPVGSDE